MSDQEIIAAAYRGFNARDIDAVLASMSPDVDWPNGWEGGRVHGYAAVREYWTRQWAEIAPHVEPQSLQVKDDGRILVDVHQVVHDLAGNLLADDRVQHLYTLRNGLICAMEIVPPESPK